MRTQTPTPAEMSSRIARFADLPLLTSQASLPKMPLAAVDLIYSREIRPVIRLDGGDTPISGGAPIVGAGGMTLSYALCPAGTGPSLHAHVATYETFTVLQSQFEFSWGDEGEHVVVLDPFDVMSVPPGVSRAFRNVGDVDGILQVVITGGVHDLNDIAFVPSVARALEAIEPTCLAEFQQKGFTFEAGVA